MARLWADDASDEDRAACDRWRAEHPQHDRAWLRLQEFEGSLRSVPPDVARHALRETASGAGQGRRRVLQLLGLGALIDRPGGQPRPVAGAL